MHRTRSAAAARARRGARRALRITVVVRRTAAAAAARGWGRVPAPRHRCVHIDVLRAPRWPREPATGLDVRKHPRVCHPGVRPRPEAEYMYLPEQHRQRSAPTRRRAQLRAEHLGRHLVGLRVGAHPVAVSLADVAAQPKAGQIAAQLGGEQHVRIPGRHVAVQRSSPTSRPNRSSRAGFGANLAGRAAAVGAGAAVESTIVCTPPRWWQPWRRSQIA